MTNELVANLQLIVQQDSTLYKAFYEMKDQIQDKIEPHSFLTIVNFLKNYSHAEKKEYLKIDLPLLVEKLPGLLKQRTDKEVDVNKVDTWVTS